MAIVKKIFDTLGLENDRLRLTWISASEGNKFAQVGNEYTEQIVKMGQNPTKKHIFL
jgi:F420-non-reducing hydrogenase iron-sulfur subunit